MTDLTSTYGGVPIKNPLILASGPSTSTPEACKKASDAGWAGVVLKSFFAAGMATKEERSKITRPVYKLTDWSGVKPFEPKAPKKSEEYKRGRRGRINKDFIVQVNPPGDMGTFYWNDDYVEYVNQTKRIVSKDCLVIASIGGETEEDWIQLCNLINQSEADLVELNFGKHYSPAVFKNLKPGLPIGSKPELAKKFTELCVKLLNKPAVAKLPPFATIPLACAQACQEGGAAGITFSNSGFIPSLVIDIEKIEIGLFENYPVFASSWGPWVLPWICGNIANFTLNGVNIDISGLGGAVEATGIIKILLSGASSAQSCRAVMVEGWEVVGDWLEFITNWMERKGFKSIHEIKGLAAKKVITDYSKLPMEIPLHMGGPEPASRVVLDSKKCINCGWCAASCFYFANKLINNYPEIDRTKCEVCGMCVSVCPTKALSIAGRRA